MVSLRPGESSHDIEYQEDQDAFVQRCQEECGSTYNILFLGKTLTVVSGPQVREVFMNNDFSALDSLNEFTSMQAYFDALRKSNLDRDNSAIHHIVRDMITANLATFSPTIVIQLEKNLEKEMGELPAQGSQLVAENPMKIMQEMIAGASKYRLRGVYPCDALFVGC